MANLQQLYQDVILDHNKNPRNFKEVPTPTHKAHGVNPLCGDDYWITLEVKDNAISAIGFTGSGCAISKSSGSLMTSMVKDKTVQEALALKDHFLTMITTDCTDECRQKVGRLKALEGVKQFPVRVKCATLVWRALEAALEKGILEISTESQPQL